MVAKAVLEAVGSNPVKVRVLSLAPDCKMKYSKDLLEPIVKESTSISEVVRKLGLALAGGTNSHLKRLFKKFEIDTSHFRGKGNNYGKKHKGGYAKLVWQDVLVYDRHMGRKENVWLLKRALLECGAPEKCEECGMGTEWNGKSIVLSIDHRNGNPLDNRPGNPRFLCPNCHSQTPTFGTRNINKKQLTPTEEIQKVEDRRFLREINKAIKALDTTKVA